MAQVYQSFNDLIDLSLTDKPHYVDCSLTLHVDGIEMQAYNASIVHGDILFYTDRGTVTYLIDTLPGQHHIIDSRPVLT